MDPRFRGGDDEGDFTPAVRGAIFSSRLSRLRVAEDGSPRLRCSGLREVKAIPAQRRIGVWRFGFLFFSHFVHRRAAVIRVHFSGYTSGSKITA